MVAPLLWATLLRCPASARIRAMPIHACDDAVETFAVGDRVRGLYGASALGTTFGCKWFDGEIVADNGDTYRVQYDDGDIEDRVKPKYLRPSSGVEAAPSSLEAQAAASRRRRKEAQREAGGPLRALESRLNILGLGMTLVDDAGDAILPDALIAVAVLGVLQLALLSALFQPLTTAVCALPTQGPLTAAVCAQVG